MEFWLRKVRNNTMKQGDRKFSVVETMDFRSQSMEGFLELGYVVERTVPPSAPTQDAHILIPGTWHKGIKVADRIKVDN